MLDIKKIIEGIKQEITSAQAQRSLRAQGGLEALDLVLKAIEDESPSPKEQ